MAKGGFPGGGFGGGNMQQLMRQAAKMQQDMEQVKEELAELRLEVSAGGGMVSCVVSGDRQLISLKINKAIVDPEDVELLEDTVLAAVREAMQKAEEESAKRMNAVTGGMGGML